MDSSLFIYDFLCGFSEELSFAVKKGKGGFIDKKGHKVIDFVYDKNVFDRIGYECFHDGVAVLRKGGLFGCIDKQGNVKIPFKYDWMDRFSEGLSVVSIGYAQGFVDMEGNEAWIY